MLYHHKHHQKLHYYYHHNQYRHHVKYFLFFLKFAGAWKNWIQMSTWFQLNTNICTSFITHAGKIFAIQTCPCWFWIMFGTFASMILVLCSTKLRINQIIEQTKLLRMCSPIDSVYSVELFTIWRLWRLFFLTTWQHFSRQKRPDLILRFDTMFVGPQRIVTVRRSAFDFVVDYSTLPNKKKTFRIRGATQIYYSSLSSRYTEDPPLSISGNALLQVDEIWIYSLR